MVVWLDFFVSNSFIMLLHMALIFTADWKNSVKSFRLVTRKTKYTKNKHTSQCRLLNYADREEGRISWTVKNLFVMCAAYWLTFLPATLTVVLRTPVTDAVRFAISFDPWPRDPNLLSGANKPGAVRYLVDLRLVVGPQRYPLHHTPLPGETWTGIITQTAPRYSPATLVFWCENRLLSTSS